jgi:CDP-paratose 2-epimerase
MKILITGGCGFVGSNIAIFLKKNFKNANISSLDNLVRTGSKFNEIRLKKEKIRNFRLDITNYKNVLNLKKFNLIIDCCAEPAIEASKKNPDRVLNINLIGTFNILKKCINDNANIIFLSSSRVYSIDKLRKIVKNNDLTKPINKKIIIDEKFETNSASSLYGFTKFSSEKLIKEMFYKKNLKYLINRFSVIAGPWQFGKQDQGFVSLWIAKHLYQKKLSYIGFGGRGHQVRDILHVDDVCNIIFLQIKKLNKIYNKTFNIGGGLKNSLSLYDLTKKCNKMTNNEIKITRKKTTSIFDIPYYITDNKKIFKTYKWKPSKNVDLIIKDTYEWLKNNKKLKKIFK